MRGLEIMEIKNEKFDSIEQFESDLYRLIMKQDKVDDLDDLVQEMV